jgi:Lar family restriction alleviation protein
LDKVRKNKILETLLDKGGDVDKLKPCPFCGESEEFIIHSYDHPYYHVECGNCLARGPIAEDNKNNAIVAWNKRKIQDEMLEALIESVKVGISLARRFEGDLPDCWKTDKRVVAIEKATGLKIEEVINE